MSGFCPLVELHREGSAPAACAAGLFNGKKVPRGPTSGFPLNLLPVDFHSCGVYTCTIAIMPEMQQNKPAPQAA